METVINEILNEMAEVLTVEQQKKLQQVLVKKLSSNMVVPEKVTNNTYLQMFLDAKRIEGCSERTLKYYQVTLEKFFSIILTPVRKITRPMYVKPTPTAIFFRCLADNFRNIT